MATDGDQVYRALWVMAVPFLGAVPVRGRQEEPLRGGGSNDPPPNFGPDEIYNVPVSPPPARRAPR